MRDLFLPFFSHILSNTVHFNNLLCDFISLFQLYLMSFFLSFYCGVYYHFGFNYFFCGIYFMYISRLCSKSHFCMGASFSHLFKIHFVNLLFCWFFFSYFVVDGKKLRLFFFHLLFIFLVWLNLEYLIVENCQYRTPCWVLIVTSLELHNTKIIYCCSELCHSTSRGKSFDAHKERKKEY